MQAILNYITQKLKNFAFKRCKNKADAEDLLQDTCERMIKAYDRYAERPINEQERIACIIMQRILIDNYRKQLNRPALINELPMHLAGRDDIESDYEYSRLMDIICNSADPHIKVFYQSLKGYKMREISEMYNMPIGTVTGNVKYARKKLKAILADQRMAS